MTPMEIRHRRFVENMEDAGYQIQHYQGRDYYQGPAIFVDRSEFQDVVRATKLPLVTDQMGKSGLVVYPG